MLGGGGDTDDGRPGAPQEAWRAEALCLAALALLAALLFASSSLDVAAARWFYRADTSEHWPLARQFPWPLVYRAASWITASLVIGSLVALAAGIACRRRHWRSHAVYALLSVVLAAGLLGNAVLKDHWQHPRPRDIVEFGGPLHYVPSPLIGHEGGASFPCGHCTVGFLYALGWWIWKRRHPVRAALSLAMGLVLGTLLGVGRMAAGAHFLSDIVWSALLAFIMAHLLHHHLLRLPAATPWVRGRTGAIAAGLGATGVLTALFATPHGTALTARVPLASLPGPPRSLEVEADTANVLIVLSDAPASQLAIDGELHGFGLPGSRLGAHLEIVPGPVPVVRYRIEARGWLTDVDGRATLRVPAAAFERVSVRLREGNIRVSDTTRSGVVGAGRVRLELHTGRGHVQYP